MKRVTLAIPVYNVEEYVEQSLISALDQTYENIEFLVIDDKGRDGSMDIVKRVIESHPRGAAVRVLDHIINQGTGATKNSAMAEATGDYLFFMDSDDVITPTCIEVMCNKMAEHPVDFVVGSSLYIYPNGSKVVKAKYDDATLCGNYDIVKRQYCSGKDYIICPTWNKLFDLNFLRRHKINCVPHHLNEDNIFNAKVMLAAESYSSLDEITYLQSFRADSTMGKIKSAGMGNMRNIKEELEIAEFLKSKLAELKGTDIYPMFYKYASRKVLGVIRLIIKSNKPTVSQKIKYLKQLYQDMPSTSPFETARFTTKFIVRTLIYPVQYRIVGIWRRI